MPKSKQSELKLAQNKRINGDIELKDRLVAVQRVVKVTNMKTLEIMRLSAIE